MKTHDFYQPLTSAQLNENLEKQFGGRVNLIKYTREELEDMRNKLRTRIFQQEGSAGINDLLTNETYQKDKTMMQLLNTRIKEMLGENIKALKDKMIELSEGKKSYKMPKRAKGSKPDFLDMDKDGDKKEPMKKAVKDKKKVKESMFKHNVRFVNESLQYLINEDEEGKAKAITAASDIVNDFTSWMQRVGQYQTKAIIELADAIKADFGAAEAETFKQSVAPALSSTLETLTQQREAISNAVAVLAGEAAPEEPMGMEPGMDMPPEPGMDMSAPDEMNAEPAGDEFAGADAAAGAGTTGREMRESKFARKLAESHSILSKLAK